MIAMIRHGDRLGETLRFIVNTARPDRVDVAPVIFFLRMLERIAVHLGGRCQNERSFFVLGQSEGVVRAERAHLESGDREFQIINRTGRRCEVKNVVDLFFGQKNEIRDVVFDELELLVAGEMSNVRGVAGD